MYCRNVDTYKMHKTWFVHCQHFIVATGPIILVSVLTLRNHFGTNVGTF